MNFYIMIILITYLLCIIFKNNQDFRRELNAQIELFVRQINHRNANNEQAGIVSVLNTILPFIVKIF